MTQCDWGFLVTKELVLDCSSRRVGWEAPFLIRTLEVTRSCLRTASQGTGR